VPTQVKDCPAFKYKPSIPTLRLETLQDIDGHKTTSDKGLRKTVENGASTSDDGTTKTIAKPEHAILMLILSIAE